MDKNIINLESYRNEIIKLNPNKGSKLINNKSKREKLVSKNKKLIYNFEDKEINRIDIIELYRDYYTTIRQLAIQNKLKVESIEIFLFNQKF